MAKAELNQIGRTTLSKGFCNNTSVFLHHLFCYSATHSIYTEAQRKSFGVNGAKHVTSQTRGPNRPSFIEQTSRHRREVRANLFDVLDPKNVTSQTWGPNQPPLIQKASRQRRRVSNDLLDVFDPKKVMSQRRGPNQPP